MTHRSSRSLFLSFVAIAIGTTGCFITRPNEGGAQMAATKVGPRQYNPADVAMPAGYRIEPLATGLTYPTGIAFDERGRMFVVESGYCYGEDFTTPRLLRYENGRFA